MRVTRRGYSQVASVKLKNLPMLAKFGFQSPEEVRVSFDRQLSTRWFGDSWEDMALPRFRDPKTSDLPNIIHDDQKRYAM